jgi:DHA2 family multidrug resistance protein
MTSAAPPAPLAGARLWIAAILLGLGNFVVILDTTIANVSVPHIAGALAVSPSQATWVITSYSVAEAITVPLTGWLAQRFGPVKIFFLGMAGFGIFSVLCGLAPSFGLLVAFRVLQGLCGGPLISMSQTLMLQIFPPQKVTRAILIWSMTTVLGPVAGPILGGNISDTLGWSWIFFINVPIALVVVGWGWPLLANREAPTRRVPVDYGGLGLLVLWVGAVQVMLDKGKELEWFASGTIIGLAVVAVVGFCAFLIWEMTAEHPIIDLRIFRHRGFAVGAIIIAATFGAYFASIVLLPLWLQTSMGYTATTAGYATAGTGVMALVASPVVARLAAKADPRALVSFGVMGLAVMSLWRTHFTSDLNFWAIAVPQIVMGVFMPFFFIPSTALTLSSVEPAETASAAGVSNFLRTMAAAFGASVMTTAWDNAATVKRTGLVQRLNDLPDALGGLAGQGLGAGQALSYVDRLVQTQSVMLATSRMYMISFVIFLAAAASVWLAPPPRRTPGPPRGH